jgi:hypothetical protein
MCKSINIFSFKALLLQILLSILLLFVPIFGGEWMSEYGEFFHVL